jgi:hypothetical protein
MKWLYLIPLLCAQALGATIYVAQSSAGSNNGTSCANAYAYNDATHGVNNNQSATFAAGNTIEICGQWISSTNGQTWIQSNLSGSSGNLITIQFVSSAGCGMYAPYHASSGAIAIQGSYYLIDGGGGCSISNTLNGTASYAGCLGTSLAGGQTCTQQNQNTRMIYLEGSHIEVRNFGSSGSGGSGGIGPGYMIQPGSGDTNASSDGIEGIIFWPGGPYSNITVDHNTVHDMNHAIDGYGNTVLVDYNEVYDCGRCILGGPGTVVSSMIYHDNIVHDLGIFDGTGVHEDGFHLFPSTAGTEIDGLQLYNNYLYNPGTNNTAFIYLEGQFGNLTGGAAPEVFNNLCILAANQADFCFEAGMDSGQSVSNTGGLIANNTCIGGEYGSTSYSCFSIASQSGASNWTNILYYNNVHILGGNAGVTAGLITIGTGTTIGTLDYNLYENINTDAGDSNGFGYHGSSYSTLSAWQTATSSDSHAVYNTLANLKYSATTGEPQTGSPGIQAGINLTSLGISALNCDKPVTVGPSGTGTCNARPSSGSWDIGAYQYTSGSTYTITISSITGHGTITSSDSVINCTTGTTGTCTDSTATGTVTLTETPAGGYTFTSWGGGACSGSASTCAVSGTATVTATFTQNVSADTQMQGATVLKGSSFIK